MKPLSTNFICLYVPLYTADNFELLVNPSSAQAHESDAHSL
jgi:hypothetical protein